MTALLIVLLALLACAWWVQRALAPDRPQAVAGLWLLALGCLALGIARIVEGW